VSVANIRTLRGDAEVLELLGALLEEVRGLRADLRKQSPPAAVPMLLGALEERYGPARFTVHSVLEAADEDPHGPLAEAVALVVDMNASAKSRATALGALLSRLPEVEVVAEQRGASIYRLRRL
jgi:hypothetical protein